MESYCGDRDDWRSASSAVFAGIETIGTERMGNEQSSVRILLGCATGSSAVGIERPGNYERLALGIKSADRTTMSAEGRADGWDY